MTLLKSFLILPFVLTGSLLLGQPSVSEQEMSMNLGIQNALILDIPDAEDKFVEKLWRSYVKQFGGRTKKIRRTDEWLTDNATISSVSADWLDLYASFSDNGSITQLYLWVDLGDNEFVNSTNHADQFLELENILLHFAEEVRKENINLLLAAEEKRLRKLESELKRLERANDGYHKEIENAKDKIKKAEVNIINNEKERVTTNDLILKQRDVVEAVREKLKES